MCIWSQSQSWCALCILSWQHHNRNLPSSLPDDEQFQLASCHSWISLLPRFSRKIWKVLGDHEPWIINLCKVGISNAHQLSRYTPRLLRAYGVLLTVHSRHLKTETEQVNTKKVNTVNTECRRDVGPIICRPCHISSHQLSLHCTRHCTLHELQSWPDIILNIKWNACLYYPSFIQMKKGSRLCIYKLKGYIERKHKSTQMAVHTRNFKKCQR